MAASLDGIEKVISISGIPKSGTTLLHNWILSHPDTCGPGVEIQDLDGMPDKMRHYLGHLTFMDWANPEYEMCYWAGRSDCTPELANQVNDVLREYYRAGKTLVIKSPSNLMRTMLINELFPNHYPSSDERIHHIMVVRNPYANVPSIIDSRMHDERYPHILPQLTTVEQAARQCLYATYLMLSLKIKLGDKKVKMVRYEDMVDGSDIIFGDILRFCHLDEDFPPPLVETTRNQERVEQLGDYEIKVITQICGPMLQHFCYDRLGPKSKWHNH